MSDQPNLIYLVDARMPTEKAHGWQMMKMCEAFARQGVSVELRVPRRKQYDPKMPDDSFDYYGIDRSFRVRHVTDVDVIALEPRLPVRMAEPVLQAHAAIWEAAAVAALVRTRPDLIYTRDLGIAIGCAIAGLPSALEIHSIPVSGRQIARLCKSGHGFVQLTDVPKHGVALREEFRSRLFDPRAVPKSELQST